MKTIYIFLEQELIRTRQYFIDLLKMHSLDLAGLKTKQLRPFYSYAGRLINESISEATCITINVHVIMD